MVQGGSLKSEKIIVGYFFSKDRCYYFLKIFSPKRAFLARNKAKMQNFDLNIVFEKSANFCSPKIVENRQKL
jgi:hypothetical protein